MNSKNTSALIGLGAIGTIIAYYGYHYLEDDEKEDPEKIENQKQEKHDETNNETKEISTKITQNKTTLDASNNNIKMEVTEQINNEKNKWSNYWAGQYKEIDKSKEIDVE